MKREVLQELPQNPSSIAAATVYTLPYKQKKVKYMHQAFMAMSPPILERATVSYQLRGFLYMNLKDIRRHLSPLLATPKGRMKRPRGQIRGTRKSGHEAEAEEAIALLLFG